MKANFPFGEIVKSTRTSGTWEETRQRGAGKKGGLSFFSHPSKPPNPRGSLSRSFSARFARPNVELALRLFTASSNVYNGGGLKPSATAQANSTDDITSELSEKDWEPAWGSTIDKRHVWLRISEKGDALAELFVCLFVFEAPVARRHRLSLGSCNDYKGSWWGEIIQMWRLFYVFPPKDYFRDANLTEFNQKAAIIQRKLVTSKTLNVPSFNKRCSNTDWL